jgi:hypothetical protein
MQVDLVSVLSRIPVESRMRYKITLFRGTRFDFTFVVIVQHYCTAVTVNSKVCPTYLMEAWRSYRYSSLVGIIILFFISRQFVNT